MRRMRGFGLTMVALGLVAGSANGSKADLLITFDDLPNAIGTGTAVPTGYQGFNWSNFYYANGASADASYGGAGYASGVVSGSNIAYNGYGEAATVMSSSATFNLVSAYLTGAFVSETVTVQGFVGGTSGTELYYKTYSVNTTTPALAVFNFTGIDTVEFTSGVNAAGSQFVIDNVDIGTPAVATPEPSTVVLATSSVPVALLAWRRRRQRRLAA